MRPKAFIFDFDGVLVDSLAAHLRAWTQAVEDLFGKKITNPEELSGHSSRTIAHILAKRFGNPSMAGNLRKLKENLVCNSVNEVAFYADVKAVFDFLTANAKPFSIGSNSSRKFVTSTLTQFGLNVDTIVTACDVSRHKPAPDIFWTCANKMGILPADRRLVVVFEDSPHGIRAAVSAGMTAVGVTTAVPAERLLEAGASKIAPSIGSALRDGWFEEI